MKNLSFVIPPFQKDYIDYVRITNLEPWEGPVEFRLDVHPDQVMPCSAPETVRANFAPPRIQRISSLYTEQRSDESKPVHAAFLGGVAVDEIFEVQVDWRDHEPAGVIFHFGSQNVLVPTNGNIAVTPKAMGTLPIGAKVAATAVSAGGIRSKSFKAALDVVNVPIKFPIPYQHSNYLTTAPRKELKYTVGFASVVVTNLMNISVASLPTVLEHIFRDPSRWSWIPKIASEVTVSGTGRSTKVSFIKKKPNPKQYKDALAELRPLMFGDTPHKDWKTLEKLGVKINFEPRFSLVYKINPDQHDWAFNGGEAGLKGEFKLNFPKTVRVLVFISPIGPIPYYWQGNVSLPLDATIGVKNLTNALQVPSDTQLTGSASIGLSGGAKAGTGHPDVIGIEGSFALSTNVSFQWDPWPPQGVYNWQIAISGAVKFVTFLYDITLASGSCSYKRHCPPPGGASCIECGLTFGSGLLAPEPKPMARDYLTPEFAEFIGGGALLDPQPIVANVIVANELRHAEPNISSSGSTRLLTWLTDDPLRGPVNRTQAVFSRSDDETWSAPEAIDDDGTADFHPQIKGFGDQGDAFAAWVNSSQALPDDAALDDLLSTLEISVARYDGVDRSWSAPVRLTFNDHLDHQPRLAVADDGKAMLVWVSNDWNQVFSTISQPSAIMYSVYDGSEWSAPAAAVADVPHVGNIALAYNGVEAVIAYTGDDDGFFDEESGDWDIELYAVFYSGTSWDLPIRLTDDTELDSSPSVIYDATNSPLFVWNSGGSIVSARQLDLGDLVEIAPPGLAGAASALATAPDGTTVVVWPAILDTPGDLLYAYFDPLAGSWSYPGRLTNDTDGEVWVSATLDSDGRLHAAYMSERVTFSTTLIDFDGDLLEIDQEEFLQADLVVTSVQFTADLEVLPFNIAFDPELPIPGEPLTITVEVENIGDLAAVDTQVTFYDGDPNNGGVPIATAEISGVLSGGQSAELQIIWNVPDDGLPHELFVVVDPGELLDDGDRTNNVASRAVVGPDLLIDSVIPLATATCDRTLRMIVGNTGNYPADATMLVLREEDHEGAILATFDIDPLGPDEFVEIEFVWDPPILNEDGLALLYLAVDEPGLIAELDDDNSRVVNVDLVGLGTDCNGNGVADACDIASGASIDLNGNGIPDECEILYVNAAAAGSGNGGSWGNAFTRLQDALEAAGTSGGIVQHIWVAAGVYTPDEPGGDRGRSFVLVDGVRVYGGFSGSEARLSDRDMLANVTVLSGDLDGDDDGLGGGLADNSYHVVIAENVGSETVLDGFLIMGGMADGPGQDGYGAGLWIINGGPMIRNCTIAGSTAFYGGGASISNSEAVLVNCVFSGNLAIDGAGLHMIGGSTSLVNCTISRNLAAGMGGGVFSTFSDPRITNSILWANEDGDGGGETAQLRIHAGTPLVNYSCIEGLSGALGGTGNISSDPLFVNPFGPDGLPGTADDDLALSTGSPCIDAGDNAALPLDFDDLNDNQDTLEPLPFDRTGRPRKVDDPATSNTGSGSAPFVDMGAYEFQVAGKPRGIRSRPVQSGNTQLDSSP